MARAEEIDLELQELEARLERLRALYEQYFIGIEKLEPVIPRQDVDRRIFALRKAQIRNTAKRFKLQTIIQRYNSFQQYWVRICREIENGTYYRHVVRAERRFGAAPMTNAARRRARRRAAEAGEEDNLEPSINVTEEAERDLDALLSEDLDPDEVLEQTLRELGGDEEVTETALHPPGAFDLAAHAAAAQHPKPQAAAPVEAARVAKASEASIDADDTLEISVDLTSLSDAPVPPRVRPPPLQHRLSKAKPEAPAAEPPRAPVQAAQPPAPQPTIPGALPSTAAAAGAAPVRPVPPRRAPPPLQRAEGGRPEPQQPALVAAAPAAPPRPEPAAPAPAIASRVLEAAASQASPPPAALPVTPVEAQPPVLPPAPKVPAAKPPTPRLRFEPKAVPVAPLPVPAVGKPAQVPAPAVPAVAAAAPAQAVAPAAPALAAAAGAPAPAPTAAAPAPIPLASAAPPAATPAAPVPAVPRAPALRQPLFPRAAPRPSTGAASPIAAALPGAAGLVPVPPQVSARPPLAALPLAQPSMPLSPEPAAASTPGASSLRPAANVEARAEPGAQARLGARAPVRPAAVNRKPPAEGAGPFASQRAAARKEEPQRPATALGDERLRDLHDQLVAERKRLNQRGKVSLDTLASSLRDTEAKLRSQYQNKNIDFRVVIKDGKAMVKPFVG